jgi:excisionase family DNA binding protein
MTPAELLAEQMLAADPEHAREIADRLARDLLDKILAGRPVDPVVRELVAALLRATRDTPPAVASRRHQLDQAAPATRPSERDDWLTVAQAAERLSKSRRTMQRMCAQGVVEARRFGRDWQVRASAVEQQQGRGEGSRQLEARPVERRRGRRLARGPRRALDRRRGRAGRDHHGAGELRP